MLACGYDNECKTKRHVRHCALFMTGGLWRKLVGGLCIFFFIKSLIFWAFPGGISFSSILDILSLLGVLHCTPTNVYF